MSMSLVQVVDAESTESLCRRYGIHAEELAAWNPHLPTLVLPDGRREPVLLGGEVVWVAAEASQELKQEIGKIVVDAMKPAVLDLLPELSERMVAETVPRVQAAAPALAQSFVNAAMPEVKSQLHQLQPELTELARASAEAVLEDERIRTTVAEKLEATHTKMRNGFIIATGVVLAAIGSATFFLARRQAR